MAPDMEPRSPPCYPDFCGRRRLQLEVQMLNREIDFLKEELQSLEGVQPVSRCCKEVNEFVGPNPDPLMPMNKKRRKSCRIWRWLRSKLCFCFSSICCFSACSLLWLERPCCPCPHLTYLCCGGGQSSRQPRCGWPEVSCRRLWCCRGARCWRPGCGSLPNLSCPEFSCGCIWSCPTCTWSCPTCTEVQLCPKCTKTCCISGCEC